MKSSDIDRVVDEAQKEAPMFVTVSPVNSRPIQSHGHVPANDMDYPEEDTTAYFSDDRVYRYVLWRIWDRTKPFVLFIGLNPSTADEVNNDPTVRRCITYAQDWGYGGLCMMNAYALRSTDPRQLKKVEDPIGTDNDCWIKLMSEHAKMIVAAWGTHAAYMSREGKILDVISSDIHCLGTTKDGHPKHPLYLRKDLRPQLYRSWMDVR